MGKSGCHRGMEADASRMVLSSSMTRILHHTSLLPLVRFLILQFSFTINLGPIRPAMRGYTPVMKNQLDYNPRCMRRDLTKAASATFTNSNLLNITVGEASATVGLFQEELQGPLGTLRMHGAGHYAMGGDGSDVFSSLNDPAFYLHHAMIDRVINSPVPLPERLANISFLRYIGYGRLCIRSRLPPSKAL